jgi:hypothetical protein
MNNQAKGKDPFPLWLKLSRGTHTTADIDAIFEGYDAVVDFPGCIFFKQYLAKYPDAKVIYNVRDPEKWRKSVLETIYFTWGAFEGPWGRYKYFWCSLFGITKLFDDINEIIFVVSR